MPPTIAYVDLGTVTPHELAQMVVRKIGLPLLSDYVPYYPKAFYKYWHIPQKERSSVYDSLKLLVDELRKTESDERRLLYALFTEGCPSDLPENIHINIDVIRRSLKFSEARTIRLVQGIASLGIEAKIMNQKDSGWGGHLRKNKSKLAVVQFYSRETGENITGLLSMLMDFLADKLCPDCSQKAFYRLDFSCLE